MSIPLLLAPMAELSHRALRELIESFKPGADEYFSEMISAAGLFGGGPFEKFYIENLPCPKKLVYQIVGGNEEYLCRAAGFLAGQDCLGIDINMGCSAPMIVRSGAGVNWMGDIARAAALIRKIRPLVKHPGDNRRLSVKLRIGHSDDFGYLVRFCKALEEEGAELITLHPRTSKEKFKRRARWSYIPALRAELGIPVAGNGDIASAAEITEKSETCDAIMLGRLALRQPWIFRDAKNLSAEVSDTHSAAAYSTPSAADSLIMETGLHFIELLAKHQPPEFHLSRARRFFSYFCDNLKWGSHVKNLLNRQPDLVSIENTWKEYFNM